MHNNISRGFAHETCCTVSEKCYIYDKVILCGRVYVSK